MRLDDLLHGIAVRQKMGTLPAEIAGLHYDSRQIQPGWAFVAIQGLEADGHTFIPQAVAKGTRLILSERPAPQPAPVAWVQVENARQALAQAAANFFGQPSQRLQLIGVTGTNGKTTTTFLIEAMLRQAGWTTGLLGTIAYHVGAAVEASPHTTPESYDLQKLLRRMVDAGCRAAVMEVSSHALALARVYACSFAAAVFTNLTQDHLDFHGSMENYAAAKRQLFLGQGAPPPRAAVVNADDRASEGMVRGFAGPVLRYGMGASSDLRAAAITYTPEGTRYRLEGPAGLRAEVTSPLVGRVNVLNSLAAIGVGLSLGLEAEKIVAGIPRWPHVRGRFERVAAGQPFTVLVDYAHTPDALTNVLAAARELARGRLLLVFGCGGDRDRGKRPLMGQAAAAGADWVIVTSDNPRSENPEAIIADILQGIPHPAGGAEPDRARAIAKAMGEAKAGDTVVIAGKGHETYQILGTETRHFDDAEQATQAIDALRARGWSA
ncbi:MAG: UDP-N-acetylmuramoyl-L-alanyl-D-glutamate--2,6-diaminopimelate ligase [Acidobacteria bacterium]|nr:MAG: UDP-N-acetylmuramoyl-L-alanyl-D-glutamate--2,6-diaminopimelate ligase [Acidobacteriota bacterium]